MDNRTYEFNESQNQLILDLSKKMTFVSYFAIAAGVLGIISGLITIAQGDLSPIIQGVITLFIGIWTINAAKAFKAIVETQGNDIENLMGALGELRKLYNLQFWLLLIGLIFIGIGLIIVLVAMIAGG